MRLEIIENGEVVNVIEADEAFMAAHFQPGTYRLAELQPSPDTTAPPLEPRHITVGSFFDRFGAHKWPILADTNPVVQALIKDCSVRKHINLDDPQLPAGLGLLVEAGHAIDPAAVLGAPVLPNELP